MHSRSSSKESNRSNEHSAFAVKRAATVALGAVRSSTPRSARLLRQKKEAKSVALDTSSERAASKDRDRRTDDLGEILRRGARRAATLGSFPRGSSGACSRTFGKEQCSCLAVNCFRCPCDFYFLQDCRKADFSKRELSLMWLTFKRFTRFSDDILDECLLPDVFSLLGYLGPAQELHKNLEMLTETLIHGHGLGHVGSFSFVDFVTIAEQLRKVDTERIHAAFHAAADLCDDKASLPVSRLQQLLGTLGYVPLNRAVTEVLQELDRREGEVLVLDLDRFKQFLAMYRSAEGFCSEALDEIASVFQIHAKSCVNSQEQSVLPRQSLLGALCLVEGSSESTARSLLKKAGIRSCLDESEEARKRARSSRCAGLVPLTPQERQSSRHDGEGIAFGEFLVWLRRIREERLRPHWRCFSSAVLTYASTAKSPGALLVLPVATLDSVLSATEDEHADEVFDWLGCLTVSEEAVKDFLEEADCACESIDFEGFVQVTEICKARHGFGRRDFEDICKVFNRFCSHDSTTLDPSQFCLMLTYLGHDAAAGMERINDLVLPRNFQRSISNASKASADPEPGGSLDFERCLREVRRLQEASAEPEPGGRLDFERCLREVRCLQEAEWDRARVAFRTGVLVKQKSQRGGFAVSLCGAEIETALRQLGVLDEAAGIFLIDILTKLHAHEGADLAKFLIVADSCRRYSALLLRVRAGFTLGQVAQMREIFTAAKRRRGEVLEFGELLQALQKLGVTVDTKSARTEILKSLATAKEEAMRCGGSSEEFGDPESPTATFWSFVHLLRKFCRRSEEDHERQEKKAMEEVRFSAAEVEEFREIFVKWGHDMNQNVVKSKRDMIQSKQQSEEEFITGISVCHVGWIFGRGSISRRFSICNMKDLFRVLGICLSDENVAVLKRTAQQLLGTEGPFDFPSFLRIMRWMLDTNFANINLAAERTMYLHALTQRKALEAEGGVRMSKTMSRLKSLEHAAKGHKGQCRMTISMGNQRSLERVAAKADKGIALAAPGENRRRWPLQVARG